MFAHPRASVLSPAPHRPRVAPGPVVGAAEYFRRRPGLTPGPSGGGGGGGRGWGGVGPGPGRGPGSGRGAPGQHGAPVPRGTALASILARPHCAGTAGSGRGVRARETEARRGRVGKERVARTRDWTRNARRGQNRNGSRRRKTQRTTLRNRGGQRNRRKERPQTETQTVV